MRYQGGKGRIRQHLGPVVRQLASGAPIVEPFCGGLSMTVELKPRLASDLSRPVITLVEAVRAGWRPPTEISDDLYRELAAAKDETDPLSCFAGQCATFGGKWFGGLARGHARQRLPVAAAATSLLARVELIVGVEVRHCAYDELEVAPGEVVYCDPPYQGTSSSWPTPPFDHSRFWQWARETSAAGAMVLVSEFAAPDDFLEVWSKDRAQGLRSSNKARPVERLFMAPSA